MDYEFYIFYLFVYSSFGMERQQMPYLTDSPLKFMPASEKQMPSIHSKNKITSSSTHRRIKQCSSSIIQRIKKLGHTHKNSAAKRTKTKCQTEAQSTKKRTTQHASLSKKTLRKRKNTGTQDNNSKLKLSNSKFEEEALTLKSSGKRPTNKKQMFYSTCFNRNIDLDLQMMDQIAHASSDILQQGLTKSYQPNTNTNAEMQMDSITLKCILERANMVFTSYRNKCQQLQQNCKQYKQQLELAHKKINKLQTMNSKQSVHKSRSKNKQKQKEKDKYKQYYKDSLRNTYTTKLNQI